jgi:hypothetical protein
MVAPGTLAWCVGVLVMSDSLQRCEPLSLALMASYLAGVLCAVLVWKAGNALVRGERAAADRATGRAAAVVVGYNALVLAASVAWVATHRHEEWMLGCAAYATVSIVHALIVRWAFVVHRDAFPIEGVSR